jgi:hypothetical protein
LTQHPAAVHFLELTISRKVAEISLCPFHESAAAHRDRFRPARLSTSTTIGQRLCDPLAVRRLKLRQLLEAAQ